MAVAIVTGASSGIGSQVALLLASHNIDVAVCYNKNKDGADRVVDEILSKYFVKCYSYQCDISSEEDVSKLIDNIYNDFGSIDILINNASIALDNFINDKSSLEFRRVVDVNLVGTFLVTKYASRLMGERGVIVNVSSTNAIDSYYPESIDYDASKAGVISLTHNFALSLAPIRVNCVCPGWVDTPMNKDLSYDQRAVEEDKILLGRFASSEEIAKVIVFLCSKDASYINDAIIKVDGGRKN